MALLKYKQIGEIDPEFYHKLSQAESGGKSIKNPQKGASAAGIYQFTEGTWKSVVNKLGLNYTLNDRYDPKKQQVVIEQFTKDNERSLYNTLGRKPNNTELYTAHFLGSGGANTFLRQLNENPNAKSTPTEAVLKYNKGVFLDKSGRLRTNQEVYDELTRRIEGGKKSSSSSSTSPDMNYLYEVTPKITNFDYSGNSGIFADTEEEKQVETPKIDSRQAEAERILAEKTNELNFIDEITAQNEQMIRQTFNNPQQPAQPQVQISPIEQTFAGVSQFVDSPVIAQQGGKIYVDSTNDPRYQAYRDSLSLYQGTQRTIQELRSKELAQEDDTKVGVVPLSALNSERSDALVAFGNNSKQNGEWFLTYDKELGLREAKNYLKTADIKPTSFYKSTSGSSYYRPIYQKPNQEVEFRRSTIRPINNLNAEGLAPIQNTTPYSNTEIPNQYILPKYWEVQDTVNQNFGRTQTNYRVTPQNADYMLNTVAPEPYNTRVSTPYYQQGGKIFNPNLSLNKEFQNWYSKNTIEGQNKIPYSDNLDYDYLSFFMNGEYKNYKGGHFPDTYKRPNHETFSNESVYSTPENPGGYWKGENYFKNGSFSYQSGGEVVKDNNGYWNPDNWGKTVEINSPNITMKGVNQPLIGTSKETGETKIMWPNFEYYFKNTKNVIEQPVR